MKKTKYITPFLVLGALMLSMPGWGQKWTFRDPHDAVPHYEEPPEWEEQQTELPPYPKDEDLLEIHFQRPDSRFRYYLDPGSLAIGTDGAVRYVVVMDSVSGAMNVMYEGIRCSDYDYKTYAFGNRQGQFKSLSNPKWREIPNTGNNWYRHALWKHFLCIPETELGPRSRDEILTAIRYYRDKGQVSK